ncbi:MAG: bifunctional folylpolyglutamate synthase/dihydrofolate synthase [Blautia sp.]|nr:bifunctional folylpolyglutamate synthase/dihydrofolate synthase [Blautia sp.]
MRRGSITTFEEAEAYLNDTPRFTTKNTMEDTRAFLHRLGDPDRKMRIIHVAGTNGKGSVCAYMRSILEAAGYRVAVFTSPHLVDIRERFVADGEMISKEDFLRGFLKVYELIERKDTDTSSLDSSRIEQGNSGYHPTYFEYLFFIAMVLFPERNPDFCILETGLGGRLDATNSVSRKELAVITHISLDHVEYLGNTVEEIAGEKAGIMQAGAEAVFWDSEPGITEVFEEKAASLGISAHSVSKQDYRFLKFKKKSIDFSVRTEYYGYISLILRTIASYQMENAALAVRAIETLNRGRTVTEAHIRQGVENCFWAGRMEEVLPEVYVDGAHNEDGVRAFLESVSQDGVQGSRSLLFSVVRDKDYDKMVEELVRSGLFSRIAVARMQTGRTLELSRLEAVFGRYPGCCYSVYDNVAAALRELLHSREADGRVYIAGSLYLAGEIKELLKNDKF